MSKFAMYAAYAMMMGSLVASPWAGADSVLSLKKVQVTDGSQVELLFDGKVNRNQIKVEYINDIVQLSLSDVSVYPAKIFSVSGSDLTKVFAYQYAPKLVRTRLTVKGKAEEYKDRIALKVDGKMVTVRLASMATDRLSGSAAVPSRKPEGVQPPAKEAVAPSADEKILLERVLKGKDSKDSKDGKEPEKIANGKPLPSPMRTIWTLLGMLALFGGLVIGFRKFKGEGALGKILKLGGKEKMIEVVANHYLGPKKSISVIRVCGRILVLGVSNDSINLIAQFSGDGKEASVNGKAYEEMDLDAFMKNEASMASSAPIFDGPSFSGGNSSSSGSGAGTGATMAGKAMFSDLLKQENAKPSIRAQIKSRIEGLKQL